MSNRSRCRRRSFGADDWNEIKPRLLHLYLDEDLTLKQVMQILRLEHDFNATEQMFKKRLASWGVLKIIKSEDKDAAILLILQNNAPAATQSLPSVSAKILRHAKAQAKSGVLDRNDLRKVMGAVQPHSVSRLSNKRTRTNLTQPVTRSLSLPYIQAESDLLLRALKELSISQGSSTSKQQWQSYSSIRLGLEIGVRYWECNAFAKARLAFEQAGEILASELRSNILPALCLIKEAGHYDWSNNCDLVRLEWRRYFAACTRDVLSKHHPLSIVARAIERLPGDDDRELAMWNCLFDFISPPESSSGDDLWWEFALYRLQHCEQSGRYELALGYYHQTHWELERRGLLDFDKELALLQELADAHRRNWQDQKARECLLRMFKIADTEPSGQSPWLKAEAMRCLALIEENSGNISAALFLREEALVDRIRTYGIEDHDTVYAFLRLLEFCARQNLGPVSERIKADYAEIYYQLEHCTEGLWENTLELQPMSNSMSSFQMEWNDRPRRRVLQIMIGGDGE